MLHEWKKPQRKIDCCQNYARHDHLVSDDNDRRAGFVLAETLGEAVENAISALS